MDYHILDLMLQSPTTQVPAHLKYTEAVIFIRFIIKQMISALEAFFLDKNVGKFDPHVGETSCQIRAYQLLLMSKGISAADKISAINKIKLLRVCQEKLEQDFIHYKKVDTTRRDRNIKNFTLENFIEKSEYNISLSEREYVITLAFILTLYKKKGSKDNPEIDYKKLMYEACLSKGLARRLVHLYQIELSRLSCEFILKLVDELPKSEITRTELEALICFDDDKRHVLPCYWVTNVILQHMNYFPASLSLLIHRQVGNITIDVVSMHFISLAGNFYLLSNEHCDHDLYENPRYVIHGVVKYDNSYIESIDDFRQRFQALGLKKIMLANMAAHPQYSGKKLEKISFNPFSDLEIQGKIIRYELLEKKFLLSKKEAKKNGCAINNPKLFYIVHIFCDNIERKINSNEYDMAEYIPLQDLRIQDNYRVQVSNF